MYRISTMSHKISIDCIRVACLHRSTMGGRQRQGEYPRIVQVSLEKEASSGLAACRLLTTNPTNKITRADVFVENRTDNIDIDTSTDPTLTSTDDPPSDAQPSMKPARYRVLIGDPPEVLVGLFLRTRGRECR